MLKIYRVAIETKQKKQRKNDKYNKQQMRIQFALLNERVSFEKLVSVSPIEKHSLLGLERDSKFGGQSKEA